jgi:GLPGLI family protein
MPETTTFTDINTKMQYEARSFFEKDFLVVDSLKQLKWKLTDETKTIAKHLCKKATTTTTTMQMMRMNFGPPPNGGARRDTTRADNKPKEIEVVVWYTEDIPVAVGPEMYSGLPGAILEINSDNGQAITTATEISGKFPKKELVKPTRGEQMTRAQFQENMKKMMEDMQKNGRMPGMRPN